MPILIGIATSPSHGDLQTSPLARIEADLGLGTDGLQPSALVVALLFIVFAIYNWVAFPAGARGPVCIHDLSLVVLAFAVFAKSRQPGGMSQRCVHGYVTLLALAVLSNILLAAVLGASPMFTAHFSILLIASLATLQSPRWALALGLVEVGSWAIVAYVVLPETVLGVTTFNVVATLAVAIIVHVGRIRARHRIIALRRGDAQRELALQQALAEADEARRELDRKVEERTAALRAELEERKRLEEQLRHAAKLEAVGRLAGGVAHDFNNLLTVIRLSLVTVGEGTVSGDTESAEAIRDASDATERAAGLTRDLLAFARKQTLTRAAVPVGDVLGGVERMVRRTAEAGIKIEVTLARDAGEVMADRHQLEQVLLNLALNACDAMAHRGTLSMSADLIELSPTAAERRRLPAGRYVRIAVTDTGTGMDETTKASVFEPFFTTKEVGRGTGLGLAVAHGIVTQHGGQISVESELGRGSTFTVFLPSTDALADGEAAASAAPIHALARETLLVAEDEPAVRRAVQRNLERLGYHVIVAQDGADALRLADTLDGVDLLLSDVVMPNVDGPELACRLRERWPELPVLFVTGYSADRLTRTDALRTRDRILEKPYQLSELTHTIREMLAARAARA